MNMSPSPKRVKLDSSEPSDEVKERNEIDTDHLEEEEEEEEEEEAEHCTICLQSFLDKTIIPVCAHEFCFDCILLWSEQSRKCPLCSRSFDDAYLIHHIRSQYDYQKHYLPPLRSSPPPLTRASYATALRNTRRERQWGRRQRQHREEADQLERAIARRRWIYQHHLYAKHIASNAYTRYRPFPTPAQFAASPDLISRMTIFLRRELRVWPNLDVEFLTTYTIALMKSIDIRSESAVKLLSEFLDLDSPYMPGARHVNAEHFAHEIYSYLRSPYRDLNTYDQTAQYDVPPDTPPQQEMERGTRWSTEPSPSRRARSRSGSRHVSPVPRRRSSERHGGRDMSVEARREDKPSRRQSRRRSPRNIPPDQEGHDRPSGTRHSSRDGIRDGLRDGHARPKGTSILEASRPAPAPAVVVGTQGGGSSVQVQHPLREDQNGKRQVTSNMDTPIVIPAPDTPRGDDVASNNLRVTRLIDERARQEGKGDAGVQCHYVDKVLPDGGSSANCHTSRKRLAGMDVEPRNRTLSECVQGYLFGAQPTGASRKRGEVERPVMRPSEAKAEAGVGAGAGAEAASGTTSAIGLPALLLRLSDGPTDSTGRRR